jgi:hypothetical protein
MSILHHAPFDDELIWAWADWLGHGFDESGACVFCAQRAAALAEAQDLSACDPTSKAIERAFQMPHQGMRRA